MVSVFAEKQRQRVMTWSDTDCRRGKTAIFCPNLLDSNMSLKAMAPKQPNIYMGQHPLYSVIQKATEDIDLDINIIGLDTIENGMNSRFYQNNILYDKPFFLYFEEPRTFKRPEILDHPNFRGFISHIKDACEEINQSCLEWRKDARIFHISLGCFDKEFDKIRQSINTIGQRPVTLLAWGTWRDVGNSNFSGRGGDRVNSLVDHLLNKGHNIRAVMRSGGGHGALSCATNHPDKVTLVHKYLAEKDLYDLHYNSDIFLLPAKEVHSMSIVTAHSFGLPCILSKNWGMSEFNNPFTSVDIDDMEAIEGLCSDLKALRAKRINTLYYSQTHHSFATFAKSLKQILNIGMIGG